MEHAATGAIDPVMAFALVGALGVGAQWLAWRLRMPAIVVMLAAGLIAGPASGLFDPDRDIGPLTAPLISLAVAVILFEGGLTLNRQTIRDVAEGVRRLVFLGAPVGWLLSTLCLRYVAGLSWESAAVFGGIMIVTGPTVIAPMLRSARLARRPAALLQWEAIVNDPLGALAAVLAYEAVAVFRTASDGADVALKLALGLAVALGLGVAAGFGLAWAYRRGRVPEYMKVPVLLALLLVVFAASDAVLHESGLLAVTVMGIVIANAGLPSYEEMRRFKEHASILLVSGVFILLAASMDFGALGRLDWHAAAFVAAVVLLARPLTVFTALAFTRIPWRERILVAFTGPRGVVLVAVAGLFGERLAAMGVADGALLGPLAFVLVAVTVVIHGFTLKPFARALGLTAAETPGVLIVGASAWTVALAEALQRAEIPVLIADPNRSHLRAARDAGIPIFFGDILSEAAEHRVELSGYRTLIAATDNDAYNTLVATDLAPDFGREHVHQVGREKGERARHALPASLGGRKLGDGATYWDLLRRIWGGWRMSITGLTEDYTLKDWRADRPNAVLLGRIRASGRIEFLSLSPEEEQELRAPPGTKLIAMLPEGEGAAEPAPEAASAPAAG